MQLLIDLFNKEFFFYQAPNVKFYPSFFILVRPQPTSPLKRHLLSNPIASTPNSSSTLSIEGNGTPLHSGQLPCIADVRSPEVLHPQDGPCDCLSHPILVSEFER